MQALLKADEVQYTMIPVFSNKHVVQELNKLDAEQARFVRSVVLLNCGGRMDLTEVDMFKREQVNMYVIDSHRPIHHHNVNVDKKVIVLQDEECSSFDACPTAEDDEQLRQMQDYEESSHDSYDSELEHEIEAQQELEELKDDNVDLDE